jgi:hypothetical protein
MGKEFENYSNEENYFMIEIGNLVANGRKSVLSRPKYFGRQCDINDIQL